MLVKKIKCLQTWFAGIERWTSGNDWLIFFHWPVRHVFSQGWWVVDPWSSQREPQILWCVEGLALADQLSLNPFRGAQSYNTGHSDHWTWRAVQIPSGHWGPILTEPRLCHQSHSTSRIFRGNKSINSWLHNWSMTTEKKIIFFCVPPALNLLRRVENEIENSWFEMTWHPICTLQTV